jgi:epoxyqueuosine reductase
LIDMESDARKAKLPEDQLSTRLEEGGILDCLTSAQVKQAAERLGFKPVGIAPAERFVEAEGRLVEWVREGRHGEMGWIDEARARRSCRPEELLPGARSIIAVGAPYSRGREESPPPLHGRIARYARGLDYHDFLKARLWSLVDFLREMAGPELLTRVFVDTGPLADREAAVRAGLGFYGKNTCLLTPGAGSYVLLGAIVTNLPLEPDRSPVRDCGSCRLCLDACPTGALTDAYQLDARRCISYLTIELRGTIPLELRPALGAHVFGCDICQDVCPWNHGQGPIPWPEFVTPDAASGDSTHSGDGPGFPASVDLLELMALDDDGFRRRFKGSPVKRTKRRGLLRNVAVALGNSGDRRAIPVLIQALESDPEPLVRSHAAWALRRIGGPEALAALAAARQHEKDPAVLEELEA